MQREEFERLLAGYATHQNSEAENARLIDAAMGDQTLFNALADEDALRELVDDPWCKAELLQATAPVKKASSCSWLHLPQTWALAGTAAAAAAALVFVIMPRQEALREVAVVQAPAKPQASSTDAADKVAPNEPPAPRQALPAKATITRNNPIEQFRDAEIAKKKEAVLPKPLVSERITEQAVADRKDQLPATVAPAAPPPTARAEESNAAPAPARLAAKASAAPLIQYKVLRRNQLGDFVESTIPLQQGDAIRLAVTSPGAGYLALTDAASNQLIAGFPAQPGRQYELPAVGAITLDAGTERRFRLTLVNGAYAGASQAAPAGQALVQKDSAARQQGQLSSTTQSTVDVVIRFQ